MEISQLAAYMVAGQSAVAKRDVSISMVKQDLKAIEALVKMISESSPLTSEGRGQTVNISA